MFQSDISSIMFKYNYPDIFEENFIAIEWLAEHFFGLLDYNTFYSIFTRILLEHSFIFICDNIQILTSMVLGFSYLIQPFNWPFILVPNLPIDLLNMIDSPVPYLIGILGDNSLKTKLLAMEQIQTNIVYIGNKIEFYVYCYNTAHI